MYYTSLLKVGLNILETLLTNLTKLTFARNEPIFSQYFDNYLIIDLKQIRAVVTILLCALINPDWRHFSRDQIKRKPTPSTIQNNHQPLKIRQTLRPPPRKPSQTSKPNFRGFLERTATKMHSRRYPGDGAGFPEGSAARGADFLENMGSGLLSQEKRPVTNQLMSLSTQVRYARKNYRLPWRRQFLS